MCVILSLKTPGVPLKRQQQQQQQQQLLPFERQQQQEQELARPRRNSGAAPFGSSYYLASLV